MKMRKLFIVAILTLAAAFAFAGGDKDKGAAAAPAAASSSALSGQLKYVSLWTENEPQAEVIKAAIKEFTAMYPGVKITVDWMGRDGLKTIKASLDAGTVDIWDQAINQLIVNFNDYGIELSDMINAPAKVLNGKAYKDYANPALLTAIKDNAPDGKIHGIPYQPNIVAVWYNKDIFAKAGVTALPKTWDELMAVCEKVKASGKAPFSVDDGYSVLPFGMYLGRLKGQAFNKSLVDDKTGALWDDPAVMQAAMAFETMWKKGYFSRNVASNKFPAGQNEVAAGDAAMYIVASYMPNEVLNITGPDFKWGAFAFPSPAGSVLDNNANTYGMQVMQITKSCKSPEAAFNFIVFLTTGKYDKMMAENCHAIPTAVDTPWPALIAAAKPILDSSTKNIPYSFNINLNPNMNPVLKSEAQKLYGGQSTARQFIDAMKKAAK